MDEEQICRTCLSTSSKFITTDHKFTYFGQNFTLSAMIMSCAPVNIHENDGLPKRICEYCAALLQISFMVRIRILQAEKKLRNYYQKKQTGVETTNADSLEPLLLPLFSDANIKNLFIFDQINTDSVEDKSEITNEIYKIDEDFIHSNFKNNTSNRVNLTEKVLDALHGKLQTVEAKPTHSGTKYVVIKTNDLNTTESNETMVKAQTCDQNLDHRNDLPLKITNVESLSSPYISNKYNTLKHCDNSTENCQIIEQPITSCIKSNNNSFQSELKKFIHEQKKKTIKRADHSFNGSSLPNSSQTITQTKRSHEISKNVIDLTDDDNTKFYKGNNTTSTLEQLLLTDTLPLNKKDNCSKVMRLTHEEQFTIIIDD